MLRKNAPSKSARASKRSKFTAPRRMRRLPATPSIPRGIRSYTTGFPQQMSFNHKYCDTLKINTGGAGGITGSYTYAANGMFKPDQSAAGHQPSYFDTISPLYTQFVVVASRIVVDFAQTSATSPVQVGIYLDSDNGFAAGTVPVAMEQGSSSSLVNMNSNGITRVSKSFSSKSYFGTKGLGDPSLLGTASANPTDLACFQIFVGSLDVAAAAQPVLASVTIYFDAIWTQPNEIQIS